MPQQRGRTAKRAPAKPKGRSMFVKSTRTPSRAKSAPAKARTSAPRRKAAASKTQGSQLGYKSSTLSLAKPMSKGAMTAALTKSMLEQVVLRWNGVKAFSGNGQYWMQNRVVVGVRRLPWYMMDLTGVNNMTGTPPTLTFCNPFLQMVQNVVSGAIYFDNVFGFGPAGTDASYWYNPEKAPTKAAVTGAGSPTNLSDVTIAPFGRSMLQNVSISANLWGATAKATKYMVQVVRITDEDLVPDHALALAGTELTKATPKRNDFYQNMIKSWTFNPISTTGGLQARKYKVLKTQTITIEPNPTTDGDADPQCVVYKAFLKMNKICKYEETAAFLTSDADTNDQADYAVNTGAQITNQVNPTSRIYLVIRATNYGADAGDTNVNTPSFDLSVRIRHTIPK
nr:MAG: capsid protein [Chemarfal virus 72]